jgi:hypothetical protein
MLDYYFSSGPTRRPEELFVVRGDNEMMQSSFVPKIQGECRFRTMETFRHSFGSLEEAIAKTDKGCLGYAYL